MDTKGTFAGKTITASYFCLASGSRQRRQCEKAEWERELVIHNWDDGYFSKDSYDGLLTFLSPWHTWGKKYCLRRPEWKKKKFDKGSAIFHWGQKTLNWKAWLGKSSPGYRIQQMFQVKLHLPISASYPFPLFQLPNWLCRQKCERIIKLLCNYLLNVQRTFHRSLLIRTKRKT